MSDLSINQVLAQIRSLSAQASPTFRPAAQTLTDLSSLAGSAGVGGAAGGTASTGSTGGPAFGTLLKQGIDAVNSTQQSANALASAWERGDPGVDLARVMVETQKASVSFQALAQVRNRLISAYQDIMNMSI
ncbi:MAG TPA: flagellar hook-basal body complex protein FliE [Steroidobacteraceae bacterium]|jgi:flagellar hook-basal body complex protein FliE|nr:flagellar hook-basal body complex protein FliE [Steroidobacteraceae bacterium]